jgi:hypothetical protein
MSRRRVRDVWLRSSGDRVIHNLSIAADPLLVGCRVEMHETDLSLQVSEKQSVLCKFPRCRSLPAMFNSSHSVSFASTRQRLEAMILRKACFHARESWR